MRIRALALLCVGALALTACASTPTDAPASASLHEATQSAQATPAADAHDHKLDQVRAIVPQTMAFGAPMATFGDHGNLDSVAKAHSVTNWDGVEQLKIPPDEWRGRAGRHPRLRCRQPVQQGH